MKMHGIRKIHDYNIHDCYKCNLLELCLMKVNLRYCETVRWYADYIIIVKYSVAMTRVP
jgi:hypothetical protein